MAEKMDCGRLGSKVLIAGLTLVLLLTAVSGCAPEEKDAWEASSKEQTTAEENTDPSGTTQAPSESDSETSEPGEVWTPFV